ncbi:STAS domain-containing protein [Vibrio europaeus]|uniref:STAS domain-containing protein n=1 Tax=Vibrio europaeus TaxID=300876 RepID=UPI00148BB96E|nr:lipid asymmetry maintenance protein MlaB [Vibrio europaeus]MDC5838531.1 lipid asymmetry maintenance protein MlaB [Vibrio europaeus]NOH24359.1 STAS domain-containing protein [Vibrio europaeus]
MTEAKWQMNQDSQYSLMGDLNRDTVPKLWLSLQALQLSAEQVEFSLENVTRIDSAGMVMLIHLIENAKKQNCHIMLSFVPEQLRTLFQLSNVDDLIAGHLKNTTGVNCG